MPQFDPSTFASQIFWLVIVFGALFWFMTKKAIPRMTQILETRAERIQGDLDRAAKLQQDAVDAAERHAAEIAKARDEARELLRDAQAKTQAALDEKQEALGAELAKQASDAESRIAAAREEAMASVRGIAVDAAEAVASRLTGSNIDRAAAEKAVDDALQRRAH